MCPSNNSASYIRDEFWLTTRLSKIVKSSQTPSYSCRKHLIHHLPQTLQGDEETILLWVQCLWDQSQMSNSCLRWTLNLAETYFAEIRNRLPTSLEILSTGGPFRGYRTQITHPTMSFETILWIRTIRDSLSYPYQSRSDWKPCDRTPWWLISCLELWFRTKLLKRSQPLKIPSKINPKWPKVLTLTR